MRRSIRRQPLAAGVSTVATAFLVRALPTVTVEEADHIPAGKALGIGLATYVVKVSGLAVLIGVLESMFAKLRLFRVTDLLGVAFILALLGLVFFYVLRG